MPPVEHIDEPQINYERCAKRARPATRRVEIHPPRPPLSIQEVHNRMQPVEASSYDWYCMRQVDTDFHLGVLAYYGVYRGDVDIQILQNHNPFNAMHKDTVNWLTVFDEANSIV